MIFPFPGSSILKAQDTVTLISNIPLKEFDLYYENKYGDLVKISNSINTLMTQGKFIEIVDSKSTIYWLRKGNYTIYFDGDGRTPIFSTLNNEDQCQNNEAVFWVNIYKNNLSFRNLSTPQKHNEIKENVFFNKSEGRYQQKLAYLEQCKQSLSPQFYDLCKKFFLVEYLKDCLYLYISQKIDSNIENEEVKNFILSHEDITLCDELLFSSQYKYFYSYYQSVIYPFSGYSHIKNQQRGEIRDYFLFKLVKDANNNDLLRAFLQDCQDKDYSNYIQQRLEGEKKMKDSKEYVLQGDSVTPISIEEMLSKYNGKFIYLDIWASWCAPCRAMIPFSHKNKEKLSQEDVVFVYLSIDENIIRWRTAVKDEGIDKKNSYLISQQSSFIKEHQIIGKKGIPYYMIFDRKGRLIIDSAMRPDESNFVDKMNEIISNNP